MPTILDNEISLAVCDGAGWSVSANCETCRILGAIDPAAARRHVHYRRPIVHLLADAKPWFRCSRCGMASEIIFVSRQGDGRLAKLTAPAPRPTTASGASQP